MRLPEGRWTSGSDGAVSPQRMLLTIAPLASAIETPPPAAPAEFALIVQLEMVGEPLWQEMPPPEEPAELELMVQLEMVRVESVPRMPPPDKPAELELMVQLETTGLDQ